MLLMTAGALLGVDVHWLRLPEAFVIVALVLAAYSGIGLLAAALVVSFRTNAAIPQALLVLSTLLGGVYFPTTVLPPVVSPLAEWLPLTPGLRALRQTLLLGYPVSSVAGDLARLAGLTLACVVAGAMAMRASLQYARRAGSLAQY